MLSSPLSNDLLQTTSTITGQSIKPQQNNSIANQFPAFTPSPSTNSSSAQQQHFNFNASATSAAQAANYMQFSTGASNYQQQQQQQQQFVNNDAILSLPNDVTTDNLEESVDGIRISFLNNFIDDPEIKTEPDDLTFPPDTAAQPAPDNNQYNTEVAGIPNDNQFNLGGTGIPNDFSFTGLLTEQSNESLNGNSPMNEDE